MAEVLGTSECIVEIGQQFAWIGAAFHSSPYNSGVALCRPFIKAVRSNESLPPSQIDLLDPSPRARLTFEILFALEKASLSSNGQCWHDLFRNPVLVLGYPIRRRSQHETGMEIPLPIMAALVDTQLVNKFKLFYFLKGFLAMLVATRRIGQLFLWHHLYGAIEDRISYLEYDDIYPDAATLSDLEGSRHIVGWCSVSTYHAGKKGIFVNSRRQCR